MTSTATGPVQTGAAAKEKRGGKGIILLFVGLMVAMLMASLNQMMLATALPTMVGELGGVDQMTWAITGYILASTIMMPVYGRISDLLGRKPVIIAAILLFMAGSVFGGLANDMNFLIISRVLQGIGGGGLMILSQSAIADVVPARDRGKYMGIMGAVFAVSSVAGPLLGGWLTEGPGWRWAFWVNLPLGVLALVAAVFFLKLPKPIRDGKLHIDYLGMALIAGATAAVVLVCTWGGGTYEWASPQIIGLIVAAVVLGIAFVITELKVKVPIIPMQLFKNRNFTLATIAALLISVAMFGVVSYMPTYVQMVAGVDATQAGLLMVPMMAGLLLASVLSGNLVSKTGKYKVFPVIGSAVMALGLFLISTLSIDSSLWLMCGYMAVFGIGLGLGQQILVLVVQDGFPAKIVGTATASFNYFKQVGASIGSAIVGSIFASRLTAILAEKLADLGGGSAAGGHNSLTPESVHQLPDMIKIPILESYNEALLPILLWMVPIAILAVFVTLFIKEKTLSTEVVRGDEVESAAA